MRAGVVCLPMVDVAVGMHQTVVGPTVFLYRVGVGVVSLLLLVSVVPDLNPPGVLLPVSDRGLHDLSIFQVVTLMSV